jgi:hypothetical protein
MTEAFEILWKMFLCGIGLTFGGFITVVAVLLVLEIPRRLGWLDWL